MDFISILSLAWLFFTFLFAESDKELNELLRRLRFSRGIKDAKFDPVQYQAEQHVGIEELRMISSHTNKEAINNINARKYLKKYDEIDAGKRFLIFNLFVITTLVMIKILAKIDSTDFDYLLKAYFLIHMYWAGGLYWSILQIHKIEFTHLA
jgi:hypothetical protein